MKLAYEQLLSDGELRPDVEQASAIAALQNLADELVANNKPNKRSRFNPFKNKTKNTAPKGLYIYGDVGRGKSMVMDLFYDAVPIARKRRVHFHGFMLECHSIIHEWRGLSAAEKRRVSGGDNSDDPIAPLASRIAEQASLLCFDEFQVTDVADAMILGRLYEALFAQGVTIVSTSNRTPETLYEGGLNRDLFLPFIGMITDKMHVVRLDGETDYRLDRMKGLQVYHTPVNDETTQKMREAFFAMTDREVEDAASVPSAEIEVTGGRSLFVPKSSKGVAVFSFKRLCANPLGAADYLAIAWRYHTVFIVAIPAMTAEKRNEAKRFVTLIDTLYENNVKLICSAEVEPSELYPAGDGNFEFSRTVSRLMEMQSKDYLARGHGV
ncbi:MAG: AFG1 family ATPase [Sphingomonadales bacterium]|nr:AFG1 family ATPase [Sphingomonadales bacterium]